MEFINVEYDSEHNYNSCAKYKKKVFKYKYNLQKKKKYVQLQLISVLKSNYYKCSRKKITQIQIQLLP